MDTTEQAVLSPSCHHSLCVHLDSRKLECFQWPIDVLRFRAGGAFCTGGQLASGRDTTNGAILAFMNSLEMVTLGGPSAFGATAFHPDSEAKVNFTQDEIDGALVLGQRVAQVASATRLLRPDACT